MKPNTLSIIATFLALACAFHRQAGKKLKGRPLPARPFDPFDEARLAGRHDWLLPETRARGRRRSGDQPESNRHLQ